MIRSRRAASRAGRQIRTTLAHEGGRSSGCSQLARSVNNDAGTVPRAWAAAGERHHPRLGQPGENVVQRGVITWQRRCVPLTSASCTPGRPSRPAGRPARRRPWSWSGAASRPASGLGGPAVADDRHPVGQRLGSARMWLDSSTVRPRRRSSSTHSRKTASISGSRPDVGSSRISSSASLAGPRSAPPSAGCPWSRPGLFAGSRANRSISSGRRLGSAADPAPAAGQQVDDLAAGQARPQGHVAGHVGQPAVQRGGGPPRSPRAGGPRRRRGAAGRAGCGWWWSCRPRWPRKACTSPWRTVRSRPSAPPSARTTCAAPPPRGVHDLV